jgi:hypothetical protein
MGAPNNTGGYEYATYGTWPSTLALPSYQPAYYSIYCTYNLTSGGGNHAPVANNQAVTVNQNTGKAIALTASDADGNPLTFAIVSVPTHGALTGTAPNINYQPNTGYVGTDSFTFKVNDGQTDSNVATVTITVQATLSNDATLSNLIISSGTLTPPFASGTTIYTSSVANNISSITVTPTVNENHATIKVNGISVASGSSSKAISLRVGANTINIVVTAQDGIITDTYTVTVTRAR